MTEAKAERESAAEPAAAPSKGAYERLVRWRDVGDGPVNYMPATEDFGNDVRMLLTERADMLAALHRCVEVMEFAYMNAPAQPKEIAQARAVIAKAEGKS